MNYAMWDLQHMKYNATRSNAAAAQWITHRKEEEFGNNNSLERSRTCYICLPLQMSQEANIFNGIRMITCEEKAILCVATALAGSR